MVQVLKSANSSLLNILIINAPLVMKLHRKDFHRGRNSQYVFPAEKNALTDEIRPSELSAKLASAVPR